MRFFQLILCALALPAHAADPTVRPGPAALQGGGLGDPAAVRSMAGSPAVSAAAPTPELYFEDRERGWFWYEEPPKAAPLVKAAPVVPAPPAAAPTPSPVVVPAPAPAPAPPATSPLPDGPPVGSVAWLRSAIPAALDHATDNPTPANVERYFLLQKEALDRSEVFAGVAQQVTTGHPQLDEGRRRPRQDRFSKLQEEQASQAKAEVLERLFQANALIMFVDARCSGCAVLAENFTRMKDTHGLVWKAISLDGTVLPDTFAVEQGFDNGLAQRLGVSTGGAVFLARPPGDFFPISWNATGAAEIADRVLLVASRNGLISQSDFEATQSVAPMIGTPIRIEQPATPDILTQADALLGARGATTMQDLP